MRSFPARAAEGRKMSVTDVDKIAQGRVWTGSAALPLKLVDKMGTLDDAIAEAATRGKMKDKTQCRSYPAPAPWFEDLMDKQRNNTSSANRALCWCQLHYAHVPSTCKGAPACKHASPDPNSLNEFDTYPHDDPSRSFPV